MKFSRILRACLVTVAVAGTSAYAATFHLKMGHTANKNDTQHATAEKMVELIEQRTKGDVNIAIFPAGQLGNDAAIINGVRGGTIDIVFNGASNYNGIVPNTAALELPFVFRSARHAYNVLDGAVGQSVLNELTPHGIKGLAYWESGWRAFTNNKHPITKPDDLRGLKIRSATMNNSPGSRQCRSRYPENAIAMAMTASSSFRPSPICIRSKPLAIATSMSLAIERRSQQLLRNL